MRNLYLIPHIKNNPDACFDSVVPSPLIFLSTRAAVETKKEQKVSYSSKPTQYQRTTFYNNIFSPHTKPFLTSLNAKAFWDSIADLTPACLELPSLMGSYCPSLGVSMPDLSLVSITISTNGREKLSSVQRQGVARLSVPSSPC